MSHPSADQTGSAILLSSLSKIKMRRAITAVGGALLLFSLPALYFQAVEFVLGSQASSLYRVERLEDHDSAHRFRVGGDLIQIGSERRERLGGARAFAVLMLHELRSLRQWTCFAERAGSTAKKSWHFHIVCSAPTGDLREEWFSFEERSKPLYRTLLVRYVCPDPVGFKTETLQYWPSLYHPIAYPWLTSILGVLALMSTWRRSPR
jgi:hypothetical protein